MLQRILALGLGVFTLGTFGTIATAATQPLTKTERQQLTIGDLMTKSQGELNDIYTGLSTGPIPDGESHGYVVFDDSGDNEIDKIFHAINPDGALEDFVKALGTSIWKGKVFYKAENMLMNRVGPLLRFPAKVGCASSRLDPTKPSIVLDYSVGATLPGYDPTIDWAMAKDGLDIRDEIRMVKPGVYLGRAYARGTYVLNFIVSFPNTADTAAAWADACKS